MASGGREETVSTACSGQDNSDFLGSIAIHMYFLITFWWDALCESERKRGRRGGEGGMVSQNIVTGVDSFSTTCAMWC